MALKPGTVIFWTDDCPDGRKEVRAWLKAQGYTPDQVALTQVGNEIVAVLKVRVD